MEGAEDHVLKGAQRMFSQGAVRSVFVEIYFDPAYEGTPPMWDLQAQLSEFGFHLYGLYSFTQARTDS